MKKVTGIKALLAAVGLTTSFLTACTDEWKDALDASVSKMTNSSQITTYAGVGGKVENLEKMKKEILERYVNEVFSRNGLASSPESLVTEEYRLKIAVRDYTESQGKPTVEIELNSQTGEITMLLNPRSSDASVAWEAAQALYQFRLEQEDLKEFTKTRSLMDGVAAAKAWLNTYDKGQLGLGSALDELALGKIREALVAHEIGKINEKTRDGEAVPGLVKN